MYMYVPLLQSQGLQQVLIYQSRSKSDRERVVSQLITSYILGIKFQHSKTSNCVYAVLVCTM